MHYFLKRLILFCLISFISATSFCQQIEKVDSKNYKKGNDELPAKRHFLFHFYAKNIDTLAYYKAAYYFTRFNNYRFYDKRRIIHFADKTASIELYSVKELFEKYGKVVTNYVKDSNSKIINIEFLFSNGQLKEQLIQKD